MKFWWAGGVCCCPRGQPSAPARVRDRQRSTKDWLDYMLSCLDQGSRTPPLRLTR